MWQRHVFQPETFLSIRSDTEDVPSDNSFTFINLFPATGQAEAGTGNAYLQMKELRHRQITQLDSARILGI